MNAMPWANYHSHTYFCDGKYPPNHYLAAAYRAGFAAYGISSHAPLPFGCGWSMSHDALDRYFSRIHALKQQWDGRLEVYYGMEVDYVAGVTGPHHPFITDLNLDYCIGSVHFAGFQPDGTPWEIDGPQPQFRRGVEVLFGGDVRRAVETYYAHIREMVARQPPDVVGHLDKIKIQNLPAPLFEESTGWHRDAVLQTLHAIARAGVVLEVNTRGLYKKRALETYPGHWALTEAHRLGIPVTISSDAHHPREIASCFPEAARMLRQIGFRTLHVLWNRQWQPLPFDEEGIRFPDLRKK